MSEPRDNLHDAMVDGIIYGKGVVDCKGLVARIEENVAAGYAGTLTKEALDEWLTKHVWSAGPWHRRLRRKYRRWVAYKKLEWFRSGSYRAVIVLGNYAIKVPLFRADSFKGRLHSFLHGWQQNLVERAYSKTKDKWLCPVYFSFFGLFNVMPWCYVSYHSSDKSIARIYERLRRESDSWYLVEEKQSSFGMYRGRIVAVDYGNDSIALQQDKLRRINNDQPLKAAGMEPISEE
jgi:hypothetical protein